MCLDSILFVDDNRDFVHAYTTLLRESGFVATGARSCAEALECCEREATPTLAIVDLKMPGMDGPRTIAALRERRPLLKVIATSGQHLQPYFGELADLGVRFFLPKPFTIENLRCEIRELESEP